MIAALVLALVALLLNRAVRYGDWSLVCFFTLDSDIAFRCVYVSVCKYGT